MMIAWLQGIILEKKPPALLLNVSGVGYEILLPMTSFYQLPEVGQNTQLYLHHHIREDAEVLYGFMTAQQRQLFKILIKVNGIGPKLALTLLSGMSIETFLQCVAEQDIKRLTKLPGVGQKTAARMLVELGDKLKLAGFDLSADLNQVVVTNNNIAKDDAIAALVALGYKTSDATKAIAPLSAQANSQDLIRQALQKLA